MVISDRGKFAKENSLCTNCLCFVRNVFRVAILILNVRAKSDVSLVANDITLCYISRHNRHQYKLLHQAWQTVHRQVKTLHSNHSMRPNHVRPIKYCWPLGYGQYPIGRRTRTNGTSSIWSSFVTENIVRDVKLLPLLPKSVKFVAPNQTVSRLSKSSMLSFRTNLNSKVTQSFWDQSQVEFLRKAWSNHYEHS